MQFIDFFCDADKDTKCVIFFFKNTDINPYETQLIDLLPDLNYISSITNVFLTNPARIESPNHGVSTGEKVYIYGVEGPENINDVQYTVTVVDNNNFTLDGVDATGFDNYLNFGVVVERQFYKTKVWKRAYAGGVGYQHRISVNNAGIKDPFRIHAFKPQFKKIGKRTIN